MHNNQNIYKDSQSVHNHNIQKCIRQSISNILNIKPIISNVIDLIISDDILTLETKQILIDYSNDTYVHSTLNITFNELLLYVFNRIQLNEHKDEIKRILKSGGKVLVVDWAGGYGGMGPLEESVVSEHIAEELFITGGFYKVKDFRAGPHHYAIVFTAP